MTVDDSFIRLAQAREDRLNTFLDYDQVAARLAVSTRTVRRLIAEGELRAHRIGGQIRVRVGDLEEYLSGAVVEGSARNLESATPGDPRRPPDGPGQALREVAG